MDMLYTLVLKAHMIAGVLALLIFWIPALVKKGSPLHRRLGRWFLLLMLVVSVTGIPLTFRFLMLGQWVGATFLGYLLVITITAISTAWFALQLKYDPERYFGIPFRLLAGLNLLSGGSVLYLGLANDVTLLTIFSFIGIFAGIDMLRNALQPQRRERNWWLHEHLGGMIGAGIAAHVAFGAFGLRRLFPEYGGFDGYIGMLPWLLPPIIGIAAAIYSARKYRVKLPAAISQ